MLASFEIKSETISECPLADASIKAVSFDTKTNEQFEYR